jgi:hypothetical protein
MFNFLFFQIKGVFFIFNFISVNLFFLTLLMCLFSIWLALCLSICLFVNMVCFLYTSFSFCISITLSFCLSINLSFCLPINLSFYQLVFFLSISVSLRFLLPHQSDSRLFFQDHKITYTPLSQRKERKKDRERKKRKENRKVKTEEQRLKHPRELW